MKNKNEGTISNIIKVINVVWKVSPGYIISTIVYTIFQSILPFVNIIFSYLILDGLIYKYEKSLIYKYVFLLIIIDLVIGLLMKLFHHYQECQEMIIDYTLSKCIADKSYVLDYEQLEDSEVMNLIQKAKDGSNSSGGIPSLIRQTFRLINNILQIIYAIILLVGLLAIKETSSNLEIVKILNNPFSAFLILITLIISTIVSTLLSKKDAKLGYEAMLSNIEGNRHFGYLYSICANYKNGKEIRLYSMQDMLCNYMTDKKYSVDTTWRNYSIESIKIQSFSIAISRVLMIISYLYVGLKAYYNLITIGSVVSYVSAITLIASSITSFINSVVYANQMASYLKHYFTYLNLPTKMAYGKRKVQKEKIEIEFRNVSFAYPKQEQKILDNVSFKINNGQKIAIVGQNGAGKTTLIKLLCRLYDPTEGSILINGINIKEYDKESLYDTFSVVFQDFKLFSYSIANNISASNDGNRTLIKESLDKAGLKTRIETMEKGIDTIIYQKNEEKGVEISGGEAQKIAIARALYKNSPMIILDEPTSALDPLAEADIYFHFKDMVNGKTSIFISHRMSSCKFCDEIIVLENGRIEEIGTHEKLVMNKGLYNKMWSAQAKYYN